MSNLVCFIDDERQTATCSRLDNLEGHCSDCGCQKLHMEFLKLTLPPKKEVLDRKKVLEFFQQIRPTECNIDDRHYIYGMSRVTLADLFLMEVALGHMDIDIESQR